MPKSNLWSAQIEAIRNLEKSLAANKRRALIQMATGSGKTYTAVNFVYPPHQARKFTELYNVQHLQRSRREAVRHRREARRVNSREQIDQSAQLDRVSRACISTIQRLAA